MYKNEFWLRMSPIDFCLFVHFLNKSCELFKQIMQSAKLQCRKLSDASADPTSRIFTVITLVLETTLIGAADLGGPQCHSRA